MSYIFLCMVGISLSNNAKLKLFLFDKMCLVHIQKLRQLQSFRIKQNLIELLIRNLLLPYHIFWNYFC